jgi:hypothetical protein
MVSCPAQLLIIYAHSESKRGFVLGVPHDQDQNQYQASKGRTNNQTRLALASDGESYVHYPQD